MQIDRWTLNQFGTGFPDNSRIGAASCRDPFYQYGWQFDALSRDEIALAIQKAEDMLAKALNFYPAPKYIVQEQIQYPVRNRYTAQGIPYGLYAWSALPRGFAYPYPYRAAVQTRWHKVWGGGTLARTLIGDTTNLALTDTDGDSVYDTFTATITVPSGTLASEIGVYFREADRVPASAPIEEQWRIRPLDISVSGTTATIKGHSTLLAKPILQTGVDVAPLDVDAAASYVAQVTVYRVYRNSDDSGTAYWEQLDGCTDTPCTLETQTLCLGDRNGRMGQVFIGYDPADCCNEWRAPDQVTINYLAGEAEVNGRMNPIFAQYVAHLATGLLASATCGCDRFRRIIEYWRYDVMVGAATATDRGRPLTDHESQSPFGFSRGALYVWNRIADTQQITGVSV